MGQAFPLFHFQVSSFETVAKESRRKQVEISQMPKGCDPRDFVRWENCMNRDFTVNRLDPLLL